MGGEQHVQAARAIPVRAGSGMKSKVGRQLQVFPRGEASPARAMPGAAAMAAHAERKSEEDDGGHQGERREGGSRLDQLQEAVDAETKRQQEMDFGYERGIWDHYSMGDKVGEGGFGKVFVVTHKATGQEFACKAIPKVWSGDNHEDPARQAKHRRALRNEVEALSRLRGTLNVVHLEGAFEDDEHVFLVTQLCRGGELAHRIGERAYTERTVASIMRAVLRTLAQCHAHNIVHRDVKPGNFMLLDASDESRIKAIDFGLAVPFEDADLPLTELGFEGTPWYMAPEVLRSEVVPASDLFAAGVMAYQLLSGRFPFDDRQNPFRPALSAVWRSVLTDEPDFSKRHWQEVSEEAKDLVGRLLHKDPKQRPTAAEALAHPWLQGEVSERHAAGPRPIERTIVQRIQRFAQGSAFKRSVLELVAEELLTMAPTTREEAAVQAALKSPAMSRKASQAHLFSPGPSMHSGGSQGALARDDGGGSIHGAAPSPGGSAHGRHLTLEAYIDLLSMQAGGSIQDLRNNAVPGPGRKSAEKTAHRSPGQSRHGHQGSNLLAAYFARLAAQQGVGGPGGSHHGSGAGQPGSSRDSTVHSVVGRGHSKPYHGAAGAATPDPTTHAGADAVAIPGAEGSPAGRPAGREGSGRGGLQLAPGLSPSLAKALDSVDFVKRAVMRVGSLGDRLKNLGYDLDSAELDQLFAALDTSHTGQVPRGAFLASLIDWRDFEVRCRDQWLALLRRQFEGLDVDRDGRVTVDEMIETLKGKLPVVELRLAAERIKAEAGLDEEALEASVDFDTFARLMSHSDNALADLDLFDSRMPTSPGDVGVRGGTLFAPGGALASVLEAAEANEA